MQKHLTFKQKILVAGTLFGMFFGAGNLIFPPYLGMESGTLWPLGLACFVFFDVVVSCVGVFAINNAGGSILSIQNALGKKAGLALNTAAIPPSRWPSRPGSAMLSGSCRSPSRSSPWCSC